MTPPLPIALVGTGAVAQALAHGLQEAGYPLAGIFSRTPARAKSLAADVGAAFGSADWADLPANLRALFLCIPDDALPHMAEILRQQAFDWTGKIVAHTSGARTAEVLAPLHEKGAVLLSFHPLQTFRGTSDPALFKRIFVGLEGDPAGIAFGKRLAADLGAQSVVIPTAAKARVHLAAAVASNFLVTLMAIVQEILHPLGVDQTAAQEMVAPLIASTWENLQGATPEEALTGPIVRGDLETLQRHSDVLQSDFPHLIPVYTALAAETVRVAVRSKRLAPEIGERVLATLFALIEPTTHPE